MHTLLELARLVGGEVQGDGAVRLRRLMPIDQAGEGDLTFVANPKYAARLQDTRASAVIVAPGTEGFGRNLLVCANPYLAFARILTHLQGDRRPRLGVMPGAVVDASAVLEAEVTVFPGAFVGAGVRVGRGTVIHAGAVIYDGVEIGEDCLIHANAVIREGCRLGHRVILQPAAVIGSDGFGYAPDGEAYVKIPQVGIVALEDDVEIGACSCVDRAAMGVTRIRRGSKIDNLVQVAHNVDIGEDCIMVAQVGIAGSTRVGRHCTFGGQSAIAGHLKIGENVMLAARSGVASDTEGNQVLGGAPAINQRQWLRSAMLFNRLPEMQQEIQRLRRRLDAIDPQGKE